jgi:hypothetical protein
MLSIRTSKVIRLLQENINETQGFTQCRVSARGPKHRTTPTVPGRAA